MIVFPLAAALVSAAFALTLLRQFARKRRFSQLAWGISMAMYAVASLAVAGGVASGWDATLYRLFWLFGALLNVPWLAVGSIALLGRRAAVASLLAAVVGSAFALVKTFAADPDRLALATKEIPRGRDVWKADPSMTSLVNWYSIAPWALIIAIALWTSRTRKGLRPPVERVRGNWLIAAGVSIVAIGGFALRRVGRGSAFSIALALGVAIMFAGFLLASRAPRYQVVDPGDSPT